MSTTKYRLNVEPISVKQLILLAHLGIFGVLVVGKVDECYMFGVRDGSISHILSIGHHSYTKLLILSKFVVDELSQIIGLDDVVQILETNGRVIAGISVPIRCTRSRRLRTAVLVTFIFTIETTGMIEQGLDEWRMCPMMMMMIMLLLVSIVDDGRRAFVASRRPIATRLR